MALEGISFALGVIPEVRQQMTRIQERFANFAEGPTAFQDLTSQLDGMTSDKDTIESIIHSQPGVVPNLTSSMFCRRLEIVKQSLEMSKVILNELSREAFPESSSKTRKKLGALFQRAFRPESVRKKMGLVANQVIRASSVLEGLVSWLNTCVKMEDMNLNRPDVVYEASYVPEGSSPMLALTVTLDYNSKDALGEFETPEAELKHCVLTSDSSSKVTAAAGVVGMAGVGKTIALQGLAHEEDIKTRFPDGVHYLSLGHGATFQDVIREIRKIMMTTGATVIVDKVGSSSSLQEAVNYAVMWFRGKTCLFLIDGLWPTENRKTGYLNELLQLLRGSPNSRMAITTRSEDIARRAGLKVDFGARNPHGPVSLKLFMKYATGSVPENLSSGHLRHSVLKILSCCGGLPIALSVTGCAVQLRVEHLGDFDSACDTYAAELEGTRARIGDEESPDGTSLNAGIVLSLKYLDVEFMNWKSVIDLDMKNTVTDLYTALCVLQDQAWAPLSVLFRLWNVDVECAQRVLDRICAMSLATRQYRKQNHRSPSEVGLMLHGLHLEFCKRQAQRMRTQCSWHAQLLNGYLCASSHTVETSIREKELLEFSPREWWSVPEDGYIHSNLSRHLLCAGKALELAALLLDARWTELRVRTGSFLEFETDFELLRFFLEESKGEEDRDAVLHVQTSFEKIFKSVQHSWACRAAGWRVFKFALLRHLGSLRPSNDIVETYLRVLMRIPQSHIWSM